MSYYTCAVCFDPLPNSQRHTCGTKRCLDQWKEWAKFAPEKRRRQKNLSTLSPLERAEMLAQGPSLEELEATTAQREQLDNEVGEYQAAQQKKADSGFMPKSLRDILIANAPIKHEETDTNGNIIAPNAPNPNPTDH